MIKNFLYSIFKMKHHPDGPLPKSERRIVLDMLESKDPTELIAALDSGQIKIVQSFGRNYKSTGGQIKICMDIYGAEVHIRGGELLDCRPESYGLTRASGERLFSAIMASYCGMTSVQYAEGQAYRHEREIELWKSLVNTNQNMFRAMVG